MKRRHKGHKSRPGGVNSFRGGEYWGRRPGGREPGRYTKTRTHRLERHRAKQSLRDESRPCLTIDGESRN